MLLTVHLLDSIRSSTVRGTTITATTEFVGDLTGDTTGFHTGDVTGNVTGNVVGSLEGDFSGNVLRTNSAFLINGDTGDIDINDAVIEGVIKNTANDIVLEAPTNNFIRLTTRRLNIQVL